jgi:hypothetical protein
MTLGSARRPALVAPAGRSDRFTFGPTAYQHYASACMKYAAAGPRGRTPRPNGLRPRRDIALTRPSATLSRIGLVRKRPVRRERGDAGRSVMPLRAG